MLHFNTNFARVHPDVPDGPRTGNAGRGQAASQGVRFGGAASAGEKQQAKGSRSVAGSIAHAFRSISPARHAESFERVGNKSPEQKSKLSWMSKKAAVAARGMEERLKSQLGPMFGKKPSSKPQGNAYTSAAPATRPAPRQFGTPISNTANQAPSAAHHAHHAHHAHQASAPARQTSAARAEQKEFNAMRSRVLDEIGQMRPGSSARNTAIERYEQLAAKSPKEAMAGMQRLHTDLEHLHVRNDIKAQIKQMPHGEAREAALQHYDLLKRFDQLNDFESPKTLSAWKQFRSDISAERQKPAAAAPAARPTGRQGSTQTTSRPAMNRPASGYAHAPAAQHKPMSPPMTREEFRASLQAEREEEARDQHLSSAYMGDFQDKWESYKAQWSSSSQVGNRAHQAPPRTAYKPPMSKEEFMADLQERRESEASNEATGTVAYMGDAEERWRDYSQPPKAEWTAPPLPPTHKPNGEPLMTKDEFRDHLQTERDAEAEADGMRGGGYMGDWEQKYREYVAASKD